MSSPFSWGTRVLAAGAAAFALVLGVGFALPGTWEAERTAEITAPADAILPFIDGPEGWRQWTPWPELGLVPEGPERGPGARMAWRNPELGDGSFEIVEVLGTSHVAYRVEVEAGAMVTEGTLDLEEGASGVRVTWRERGDFGWNPLMGYWALAMARVQGQEMDKGLARLRELAESVPDGAPREAPSGVEPEGAAHQGA